MNLLHKIPIKKFWWVGVIVIFLLGAGTYVLVKNSSKSKQNKTAKTSTTSATQETGDQTGFNAADANSTDPVKKGMFLSNGKCTGQGSKKLGSAPMKASDISYIVPYGLLAGGHVTPIDHQYYWGKVPMGDPDMYEVLALDDGYLVDLTYRDRSKEGRKVKGDYRGVISYSCTFFSYFDLATSLHSDITKQLPEGWNKSGHGKANDIKIPVKKGQVIGKFGAQSLDFAVWDTTKQLKNLLVPVAYNNAEPWKMVTVNPLEYFSDEVKNQILPFYLRKIEPLDGVIDQDVDGTAAGNWFREGTNGYAGVFAYGAEGGGFDYWIGHLALVRSLYDNNGWFFSSGDVNGKPQQYGIKNPSVTPDKLDTGKGLVKYELAQGQHVDDTGNMWIGDKLPQGSLKFSTSQTQGTVLVQLLEKRKLKVEVFLGKIPSQVTAFTSAAKIYDRGDNSKLVQSNTAN